MQSVSVVKHVQSFNDLTIVKGNLTLAGTLNVALMPGSTFDPGIYLIISYNGTLTSNGLTLGTTPPGSTELVQTSVPNEVNLVVTTGANAKFLGRWISGEQEQQSYGRGSGASAGNDHWTTNTGAAPAILTAGNNNTSTTFGGTIQDGTSVHCLTKIGTSTLTLTGTNTYLGATTISAGALQIGNGGTTGSIIGNVTDNATLVFNGVVAVMLVDCH